VVATLSGRLADVGDPCPGAMHDSRYATLYAALREMVG
jgi:hypothetical protein